MPGDRVPAVDRPADDVMDAVRASVDPLRAPGSGFAQACYGELIALVPAILQTTADHGHAVTDELVGTLCDAATSTEPSDVLTDRLRRAGGGLLRAGFPPDGYQGAAHAVLRAARDSFPHDWDSSLSSAWVAWLGWAGDRMAEGARTARDAGGRAVPEPVPVAAANAVPATLGQVFEALRSGPFAGNPRALDAVATRIALRTGADLRYPRMDQQHDPALVATVLSALSRMGYAVAGVGADGPVDAASARAAVVGAGALAPFTGLPGRPADTGGVPHAGAARHGRAGTGTPARVDPTTGAIRLPADDAFAPPRRVRRWSRLRGETASGPATGDRTTPRPRPRDRVPGALPGAVPGAVPSPVGRAAPGPAVMPVAASVPPRGTFDAFSSLGDDPARATPTGPGGPSTLPEILDRLRQRTFAENDWALDGVLTRVALRTGADIRAPRPDQVADPSVVRDVLAVLDRMGYGEVAADTAPAVPVQRPRWWSRQRRRDLPPSLGR